MQVAIIGATGFVGSYIIDELVAAGHRPSVLLREGSADKLRHADQCRTVAGDVDDSGALAKTLEGCDAAIYLIGILREEPAKGITFEALQYEGARRVIDIAAEQGVKHFLLMSANGVEASRTDYQRSKLAAEQYLLGSGLHATIFRPSAIFGDPRGRMEIATQLCEQMIDPPLPAPAFFRGLSVTEGSFSMTPVHVNDVARAFVRAIDTGGGGIHELGGAETLRWPEMIRRIAAARGRRKLILPVPAVAVRSACAVLDRFAWFPLTGDQFSMLLDGNVVESRTAFQQFGIDERSMAVDSLQYLSD